MMRKRVVFRADGNSEIGLGHIYRSLALAKMIEDHFELIFLIQDPAPEIRELILETCEQCIELPKQDNLGDWESVASLVENDDLVVLDGYHFDSEYQKMIRENCYKVISIDDMHTGHFYSDVVINHCGGLQAVIYDTEPYTTMLLGPGYALLRPEFLEAARIKESRKISPPYTLFICMGGSDHYNITGKIIRAILDIDKFKKVNVVLGAANLYKREIQNLVKDSDNIKIFQNLSSSEMCSLTVQSDVAIAPGSSISFEVCAVGMGFLCGYYTHNQLDIIDWLDQSGCASIVGDFRKTGSEKIRNYLEYDLDQETVNSMINKQKIIDGYSNERLKQFFLQL